MDPGTQGTNQAKQPDASGNPIHIPISEGKHKPAVSPAGQPIHIPRYLKSNRKVDWNHLPPSSANSRFVGDTNVNTPSLPSRPIYAAPIGGGMISLASTPSVRAIVANSPRTLAAMPSPGRVNDPSVNVPPSSVRPMGALVKMASPGISRPPAKAVGENFPQMGAPSHWAPVDPQTNQPAPLAETGDAGTRLPPERTGGVLVEGGVNGHLRGDVNVPSNGQQRPLLLEQGVEKPQFEEVQSLQQTLVTLQQPQGLQQVLQSGLQPGLQGPHGLPQPQELQQGLQSPQEGLRQGLQSPQEGLRQGLQSPQEGLQQGLQQLPPMVIPQQHGVYAVAGATPNLSFQPLMGTTPDGQVVQLNFGPQPLSPGQQYAPPAPMRRPPNMIGDVPKAKDAVKRRERERVRRAIMANIISGLRNYGGYNLPSSAADIEYIRALLREAGYVTEVDGTTYRPGVAPPVSGEHPPEAATSSREDYGTAQDTPPSTAAFAGNQDFASIEPGQMPGTNNSQDQETGGIEPPGELQPTGPQADGPPGADKRVAGLPDDLMLDQSETGLGKRMPGFVIGGSEPKKLKSG